MSTIPMKIKIPVELFEDDLRKAIEMVLIREFGIVNLQDNKFKFWFDKGDCHIEVESKVKLDRTSASSVLNPIMNRPAMPGDFDPSEFIDSEQMRDA